jgi:hypothetical protein
MRINEKEFNRLPEHLRSLFRKLPNPERDEVLAAFPAAPGQLADASTGDSPKTTNVYGAMKRQGEASAERRYTDKGSTNFAAKAPSRTNCVPSAATPNAAWGGRSFVACNAPVSSWSRCCASYSENSLSRFARVVVSTIDKYPFRDILPACRVALTA